MEQFSTISSLRETLRGYVSKGLTVGFVPTMGALHNGHISLIERAARENEITLCSIFVNPTQFTDKNDLDNYPRPITSDILKLKAAGCHVLFMPEVNEMYRQNEHWHIDLHGLDDVLEGAYRHGHFKGVTQIVFKLLSAAGPSTVYFGQKDYQQFRIVTQMVKDRNLPNRLVRCPIVREPDGLALSSRNIHLSAEERCKALVLSQAVLHVQENILRNKAALDEAREMIKRRAGVHFDYLELVRWEDLLQVEPDNIDTVDDEIAVLAAAKVGHTRLIDNAIVKPRNNKMFNSEV